MPLTSSALPRREHEALGERFYQVVSPAKFPTQKLRFRNQRWAERVGLGELTADEWTEHFAGFSALPGAQRVPLALSYHGHQFDVYNPNLGDGRGFLFAQLTDLHNGRLLDLGTKGSGQTPYSRAGDGRLTLKGGFREVLASEMLEALGVYTSKAFSLIETGEALQRGDEPSPTRSSVLVRLSHSHARVGSFQRLHALGDQHSVERLVSYCNRLLLSSTTSPGAPSARQPSAQAQGPAGVDCLGFLRHVTQRSARTCAGWLAAGFVHGVLNSDNMNVTGESFDYGPYRFLPELDPAFTAAYFDYTGLYAYGHQPRAVFRNLQRLAASLEGLAPRDDRLQAIEGFEHELERAHAGQVLRRLGLGPQDHDADLALASAIASFLERSRCSFAGFFFDWFGGELSRERALRGVRGAEYMRPELEPIRSLWRSYELRPGLSLDHDYFRGAEPCDLLIDEIEALWSRIAESDDWSGFERKVAAIRQLGACSGARADANWSAPAA